MDSPPDNCNAIDAKFAEGANLALSCQTRCFSLQFHGLHTFPATLYSLLGGEILESKSSSLKRHTIVSGGIEKDKSWCLNLNNLEA